ncbi:MAG: 50S ribosomal protein L15e [archaeon]|nr:50S ribosomal protein L15e [archaeon]
MALYQSIKQQWLKPSEEHLALWKARLIKWRKEGAVTKLEHPTRLDKARALGYKPKNGIIVVRVKLLRGGRQRQKFSSGRKPRQMRRMLIVHKNYQSIAEERANKGYVNCEVLNSYYVAQDGKHFWFEVILADRELVSKYAGFEWLADKANYGRVYRGLTRSARKSRGLQGKGKGFEHMRPSKTANKFRRLRRNVNRNKEDLPLPKTSY